MAYIHTKLKNNLIKAGFNIGSWKVDYIHHVPEGTYSHIQCRIPDLTTGNLLFISNIIKDTFYAAAANAHKLSINDLVNLSIHQWNGYLYIETYFNYKDEPLLVILYNQSNGILSIETYPNLLTPEDQDEPK